MRWRRLCALNLSICLSFAASPCPGAEDLGEPLLVAPATRSVAARVEMEATLAPTAAEIALSQYLYVDFPRAIQSLANEREIAAAEVALIARGVDGYRPFRSFKQYGATYTVDQSWQIALLAARQRLECLRNDEADLWRQRQVVVAAFLAFNDSR